MPRTILTRDDIVVAAVALADEDGVDQLSMRRLAEALGSGVMSLYNHVADKDDLLEAMLEHVLADPPGGLDEVDDAAWRDQLVVVAMWLRDVLLAHPWACTLWFRTFPGQNRTQLMEAVLRTLRLGGFSRRMAHHGFHALDLYVVGQATQATQFTIGIDDPVATRQRFLDQTPSSDFPYTREHVEHHEDPDVEEDDFAFLLGLLLDGLERHRDDP